MTWFSKYSIDGSENGIIELNGPTSGRSFYGRRSVPSLTRCAIGMYSVPDEQPCLLLGSDDRVRARAHVSDIELLEEQWRLERWLWFEDLASHKRQVSTCLRLRDLQGTSIPILYGTIEMIREEENEGEEPIISRVFGSAFEYIDGDKATHLKVGKDMHLKGRRDPCTGCP